MPVISSDGFTVEMIDRRKVRIFEELLAPITSRKLAALSDQGKAHRWPADDRGLRMPGFTAEDLTDLMREDRASVGHYRFLKMGQTIDPEIMRLVDEKNRIVPERIDLLKEQGITIMASRLEAKVPLIRQVAKNIERVTSSHVRVVAIASFGMTHGMPLHYDHVDVIAVQTQGRKTWRLFGGPVPGAGVTRKLDRKPDKVTSVIELDAGDRLFVPAGIHHQCDPSEFSVHLAFNLKWPCALDFLTKRHEEADKVDTSLLEPLRGFVDTNREEAISETLRTSVSPEFSRSDVVAFLREWPQLCERRYAIR